VLILIQKEVITILSLMAFEKIARKSDVKRVSKRAFEELRDIIEDEAMEIASKSVSISSHASRNTILDRDVRFAVGKHA
jgi:histone H3/H4